MAKIGLNGAFACWSGFFAAANVAKLPGAAVGENANRAEWPAIKY
jgi:hypothetical protein